LIVYQHSLLPKKERDRKILELLQTIQELERPKKKLIKERTIPKKKVIKNNLVAETSWQEIVNNSRR